MNDNAVKKNKFSTIGMLLGFILLTTIIGMIIGFQSGMQVPRNELAGDLRVEEVAQIRAVIYGVTIGFIGITGSIVYLFIKFIQESRNRIRCPKCGVTILLSTDSFCRNCGSSLEK